MIVVTEERTPGGHVILRGFADDKHRRCACCKAKVDKWCEVLTAHRTVSTVCLTCADIPTHAPLW